jgi:hypothetical protein
MKEKSITHNGTTVGYFEEGNGFPIVFIHGFPLITPHGRMASWMHSRKITESFFRIMPASEKRFAERRCDHGILC